MFAFCSYILCFWLNRGGFHPPRLSRSFFDIVYLSARPPRGAGQRWLLVVHWRSAAVLTFCVTLFCSPCAFGRPETGPTPRSPRLRVNPSDRLPRPRWM